MKEIKKVESVKILDGAIEVKPYLSYSEVQAIVNAVIKNVNPASDWAERQETIDVCVLGFATSLSKEEIDEIGHQMLLETGIIEAVRNAIHNYDDIQKALDYMESVPRALQMIAKELPELIKPLEKVIKNGESSIKK